MFKTSRDRRLSKSHRSLRKRSLGIEQLENRRVLALLWSTFGEGTVTQDPSADVIELGVAGRSEQGSQSQGFHGASAPLCKARSYSITFEYDLATWDSYNPDGASGSGFWDAFVVSIDSKPYDQLQVLQDPLQLPFVRGGTNWADGNLETFTGTETITRTFNRSEERYLNVALDTITSPTTDNAYPSWGSIRVTKIAAPCAVSELTFGGAGHFDVIPDDGATAYTGPHWLDNDLDGQADDAGEHQYPTIQVAGTKMKVSAKIQMTDLFNYTSVMVKANGPGSFDVAPVVAIVSPGNIVEINDVELVGDVGSEVDFKSSLTLSWEVSVDGGSTWLRANATRNPLYVTLKTPQDSSKLFYTLVDLSTRNADGESTDAGVVAKVWSEFADRSVSRINDPTTSSNETLPLKYYETYTTTCTTSEILLQTGNGQCGSFASLMIDMLAVQGLDIDRDRNYRFVFSSDDPTGGGFVVKDWDFAGSGNSGIADYPFLNLPEAPFAVGSTYNWKYAEVTDAAGIPGQSTANPASFFNNHQIVKIDGIYYDPSYGATYASIAAMDDMVIAGYYRGGSLAVDEVIVNLDLNGDGDKSDTVSTFAYVLKKNVAGDGNGLVEYKFDGSPA